MKKIFVMLLMFSKYSLAQLPADLNLSLLFTSDISSPLAVRHAGDGSERLFIMHQGGIVKIWDGTQLLSTPFLDVSSKISAGGERGLLGIDFDPNFSINGYFYVSYTVNGDNLGDSVVERYQVSPENPNLADFASGVVLMRVEQLASNHNGGDIHFGPDGYLYFGIGDGGPQGDPGNVAQNKSLLLGKMLRIDVNPDILFKNSMEVDKRCGLEAQSYYVPDSNPFVDEQNSCGEIWAYGFRNPWRWSFDRQTGDLIIGDVGQSSREEISFQSANSLGGEHYGWNCREGDTDYITGVCENGDAYVEPVISHTHNTENYCSITGGYMYRGPITELQGLYVYSDWCKGDVNFATPSSTPWSVETFNNQGFGITSFGEDELGNIYMIRGSTIYRFELTN